MATTIPRRYSFGEELANSLTHGLGAALSIAALVTLLLYSANYQDPWRAVGFSIYGAALFLLYLASTLYHSFSDKKIKSCFRLLDHSSIFILIAGTYTPVTLIAMRGPWGWTLFGLIWGLAAAGVLFKLFFTGRFQRLSLGFYAAMGWIALIAIQPMLVMLPTGLLLWIIAGGLFYTFGTGFYVWKSLPYHHAVWHVFVLAGSIAHFSGILYYLSRPAA
ncbi:MAG: hemolysin III family protein [Desulfosalsimonadaceae bacterium]